MTPRILVLWASVGAGHGRAAQAVELALRETCPQAIVRNCDVLGLTNGAFRELYGRSYFRLVARAPHLVGYLYDRLDRPLGAVERAIDKVRFSFQQLNLQSFSRLLTSRPWDLAINTHFLSAEVIGTFRRCGRLNFPQVTVTTDFDTHRLWCNSPCEHYFTATEESRANLAGWGIPLEKISASGIPVHPVFSHPKDPWECRQRLGLFDERTVVLQLAGGLGIGPIERIHRELLSTPQPLQIAVVAGRNEAAREALAMIPCPARHRRIIFGFTDRMDELMAAADLVVSKPGGLTTSESLCRGAAMIVVDPIPGQETRNSDFLLENGAAIKVNNLSALSHKLLALLREPARLDAMRAAARRLGRPRAAYDIVHKAMEILHLAPAKSVQSAVPISRLRRLWRSNPTRMTVPTTHRLKGLRRSRLRGT